MSDHKKEPASTQPRPRREASFESSSICSWHVWHVGWSPSPSSETNPHIFRGQVRPFISFHGNYHETNRCKMASIPQSEKPTDLQQCKPFFKPFWWPTLSWARKQNTKTSLTFSRVPSNTKKFLKQSTLDLWLCPQPWALNKSECFQMLQTY